MVEAAYPACQPYRPSEVHVRLGAVEVIRRDDRVVRGVRQVVHRSSRQASRRRTDATHVPRLDSAAYRGSALALTTFRERPRHLGDRSPAKAHHSRASVESRQRYGSGVSSGTDLEHVYTNEDLTVKRGAVSAAKHSDRKTPES